MVFRDSFTTLNSYSNLSILLVVERFRPIMTEQPQQRQIHSSTNVFTEREIKTYFENTRHQFMTSLTSPIEEGEHLALGTFKMPKLRDVCRKDKSFLKDLKADE
jgi:GTP-sensing pleiotropic transcriptional regulator CodY